ncbi:BMP family ABC transporter substrate-binding protein [Hypericibacter terrae]|uniref:BMP family ABC transporter substrate-binding protein n=1 Tax=Hypericibacter terrae TaxID=2602015 RepID=A0A5J6MH98_9PROT|nr:BMP family protein [Hypericibacter terrae]QEX16814.1 BMP family ABC transporter substrate-binding protein [Hypericibacter terrae]
MKKVGSKLALAGMALILLASVGAQAPAAEVKSIAVLVPEQGTDFGWNQQGIEAGRAVAKKYDLKFIPVEGLGYGDIRPTLRELAGDGVDLLILHANGYSESGIEVAQELKVPIAIAGKPDAAKPGLIADCMVDGYEGAYLAGVLAARMTRTGTLGIVVSGEPVPWNTQSAGFVMGAKATKPDIKVVYAVIGPAAFSDAAGGRRVTDLVIAAGADIVFGQGDGSTFGMIEAVETGKARDGGEVWFIDVIGDKSSIDRGHLLTSVVWDLAPIYGAMVEDLRADKFGTRGFRLSLADDSVRLLKTPHIPESVWTEVMAVRAKIIDGSLNVPQVPDAQRVRALMSTVEAAAQ